MAGATSDHYDYGYLKITSTTDGATPQGQVRAISEGGFTAASGTIAVTAAFGAAPDAGDTEEVWPDWHPNAVDTIINKKLRELHMPAFFPLTCDLVTSDNNDFEQALASANTPTGWSRTGSATASMSTSVFYNGKQALSTGHPSASGDYYSRALNILAGGASFGQQFYSAISALGPNALFVVRDATNSTNIITATADEANWNDLVVPWTMPSNATSINFRLMGEANSASPYWDDYQTWYQGGGVYVLPSWITRKEQMIDVVAYPPGRAIGSTYNFAVNERNSRRLPWRFERADTRATNELFIYVDTYSDWRPYILAHRPLDEVSADYVTTTANTVPLSSTEADGLVLGVLAEMHRQMIDAPGVVGETRAKHEREAMLLDRQYASAVRHLRPESREERIQHRRVYGGVA